MKTDVGRGEGIFYCPKLRQRMYESGQYIIVKVLVLVSTFYQILFPFIPLEQ